MNDFVDNVMAEVDKESAEMMEEVSLLLHAAN